MLKFSKHATELLNNYYLTEFDKNYQEAFKRAAYGFNSTSDLSERIYNYALNGWFMFSSPVLSNARMQGQKKAGLPISCFLTYVPDTVEGLIEHTNELRWMSVKGGGVGGHWSNVRSVSDKAPGPIPFLKTVDSDIVAYKQGKTRKGSYASYLDVSHPDIIEFLNIRMPTGGDTDRKCFNLHNAINITDAFMAAVIENKDWSLVDPASGLTKNILKARNLWQRILEVRFRTGEPYLNFIDEANRRLPQTLKNKGLKIHGSNLCNEIHLPTGPDRSAVCCLSSLNLEKYEEWKDSTIVEDLIEYLDDVLQVFIDDASAMDQSLAKAVRSAIAERSLGLGAMGFHSLLQSKMIPFESATARAYNKLIFKNIKNKALKATKALGQIRGPYSDGKGQATERNSHLLAIAPNANSSIILDTSPSIEPWKSNAFTYRTRAGTFLHKNHYLASLLEKKVSDLPKREKIWQSIILSEGSVQHLDILSDFEKSIFKTAFELDQNWVVEHASVRQEYICQGQSLNLFFPEGSNRSYVNAVHLKAWKASLKGLYYLRTSAGKTGEKISQKVERKTLKDYEEECIACQG